MKSYASQVLLSSVLSCALVSIGAAKDRPGRLAGPAPNQAAVNAGVSTTVSGTIAQFNYDRNAEVEGFLLNGNTLVHLPPRASSRAETSLRKGDTVQIAGLAQTSAGGFKTIEAQTIQDRTSGKTLTMPQPGAAAPFSGSGRIQQLNYGPDGAINGFLLDNGTLAAVPPFAATNPSSIQVGSSIAYSGYARSTMSGRTVVDVQNLNINGQILTMNAPSPRGPGAPPPPSAPRQAGPNPPPAPPQVGTAPAGRINEPPPPAN